MDAKDKNIDATTLFSTDFVWVNTTSVTKGNILTREHTINVTVKNDLNAVQMYALAEATIARQVQAKFRTELAQSKDPEFLHKVYSMECFEINASAMQGTTRTKDPKAKAEREVGKLSDTDKRALLEQLKAELAAKSNA